ncbi:MAG: hypothetical protein R3F56_02675 [Planctomycetota bacterium]
MVNFEFFRKNQKLILYTAGIFALLTFSISGAMMSYFSGLTDRGGFKGASLRLADGRRAFVTLDDYRVAQNLVNAPRVPDLIPSVGGPKVTDGDRVEILSALRRLALEYGIEASDTEVSKAVKCVLDVLPRQEGQPALTAADLAARSRLSGDQYDQLMRESMRISTFLRMFAFAADTSDAQLVEHLTRDLKLVSVKVATLDKKVLEDKLKETEVSDEDLMKWLEGLPENEKAPYQDTNRLAIKAFGVKLDEFDPATFADELKDKTYDDAAIEARYKLDRELYYRREVKEGETPPEDPYLPLDEVKEAVRKRLQAEDALKVVLEKLRLRMGEVLRPAVDARIEASKTLARAKAEQADADGKVAEKPDDEALKTAAEAAKAAVEAAEKVVADAETAVDTARRAFDPAAELASVTPAKLTVASIPEPKNADALKDLPEFAPWNESGTAVSLDVVGDLSGRVQNTKAGVFFFQVTDLVKSPLKELAAIKDQLKEAYYKKKADEEAKDKLTAFEDALKRLAREAKKTEIETLEAEHTAEVDKRFDAWKAETEAAMQKAKEMRDSLAAKSDSVPYRRWKEKFEALEKDFNDADGKRKAIEAEVRKDTDEKIDKLVKETRGSVLDAAAAEAGLSVDTVGPYRKDAASLPRFRDDSPKRVAFLWGQGSLRDLKEGEATDMLEDFTNRAHHMAVVEKIEPGSIADLSRAEILKARSMFEDSRMVEAVSQSFSLDALRKGWGYENTARDPDRLKPQSASAVKEGDSKKGGANEGSGTSGNATSGTGGK